MLGHLRACADCEGRFRVLVREREQARSSGGPHLAGGAIVLPQPVEAAARPVHRRSIVAAVAAAAAILAFVVLRFGYRSDRGVAGEYWLPLDREFTLLRSGSLPVDLERFGAGLAAYRERNARRAVELLESAEVPESYTRLRDLFLASALALEVRHDDAISVLERLQIDRLPMPWRARARWVLYSTLRDDGRNEAAARLLQDLVARDDEIGPLARREQERLQGAYSGSPNRTNPAQ